MNPQNSLRSASLLEHSESSSLPTPLIPSNKVQPLDASPSGKGQLVYNGSSSGGGGGGGGGSSDKDKEADEEEEPYATVTYLDICKQFVLLGWIAFGGPAAHIGLFEKRIVEKLRWMSTTVFMELFALSQCLPGPTSTQVSFAIGTVKKGFWGGILSGALFQYPGAIMMTAVGAGAAHWLQNPSPWLRGIIAGLSATGVALVASAAKNLLFKMCFDPLLEKKRWADATLWIGTLSAVVALYWPKPWVFPSVIVLGGLVTIVTHRHRDLTLKGTDNSIQSMGVNAYVGALFIAAWLIVLITIEILTHTTYRGQSLPLNWFEVFYRTGSIIYGGGQVVLPLLKNDLVQQDCTTLPCVDLPNTWVTSDQFYAGLGIVQGMPGPLFNFAAYLGAIIAIRFNHVFITGTVLAWIGLFGPGVILIFGVLPFWAFFRKLAFYRRALPGLNAAGVGLILTSVIQMTMDVWSISPFPTTSLCIGVLAFAAVDQLQLFEPFVVLGGAVLGVIGWAAHMH